MNTWTDANSGSGGFGRNGARGSLVKANLKVAISSLGVFRQRGLLALIGIVFGVGSVIAMVSVGTIVKNEILKQFQDLGTDILTIRVLASDATGRGAGTGVSLEAVDGIAKLSTIEAVAPYLKVSGEISLDGRRIERVELIGTTAALADLNNLSVAHGRFISDLDFRRYYCVIGAKIAADLRGSNPERIIGELVRVDDAIYTVAGVLKKTPRGERNFEVDQSVIIPISTAQRAFSHSDIRTVMARMRPNVHYMTATEQIKKYISRVSRRLQVAVYSAEQLIQQMYRQMRLFTLLLGTAGGIALLVGGIGVMNVMLISVSDRRVEIGVRRALGALRQDIQWQFLIESLILSALGGVLGIVLGVGASYLICYFVGWTFLVSTTAVGLGVGITVAVGIFFGFYPAYMAARLDPIAALRGK